MICGQAAGVFVALTFIGSNAMAAPDAVEISNLKQGLMHQNEQGEWEVYQEGNRFEAIRNGECVANRESISCMWFGITFDYSANSRKTKLDCIATSREPTDLVTPHEIVERGIQEYRGELILRGRSGGMRLPGYVETPVSGDEHYQKTECYLGDELVLSVEFTLLPPE